MRMEIAIMNICKQSKQSKEQIINDIKNYFVNQQGFEIEWVTDAIIFESLYETIVWYLKSQNDNSLDIWSLKNIILCNCDNDYKTSNNWLSYVIDCLIMFLGNI